MTGQEPAQGTVAVRRGFGGGQRGRDTITTGRPRSRAAPSFAAVARPPEFLVTMASMPCSRSRRRSASTVKGPAPGRKVARGGRLAGSGGSMLRIR